MIGKIFHSFYALKTRRGVAFSGFFRKSSSFRLDSQRGVSYNKTARPTGRSDFVCKPTEEKKGVYVEALSDLHVDFCLQAKGDSMINARIKDGDIVFIRSQPEVNNGEIAAVAIGDTATLKRVYYYPEKNQITLQAENPAFPPLTYVGAELEEIRILGKAVAFQSNL